MTDQPQVTNYDPLWEMTAQRDAARAQVAALKDAIAVAVREMNDGPVVATCDRETLELHTYSLWGAIMALDELVHPPEVGGDPNGPPPF